MRNGPKFAQKYMRSSIDGSNSRLLRNSKNITFKSSLTIHRLSKSPTYTNQGPPVVGPNWIWRNELAPFIPVIFNHYTRIRNQIDLYLWLPHSWSVNYRLGPAPRRLTVGNIPNNNLNSETWSCPAVSQILIKTLWLRLISRYHCPQL